MALATKPSDNSVRVLGMLCGRPLARLGFAILTVSTPEAT